MTNEKFLSELIDDLNNYLWGSSCKEYQTEKIAAINKAIDFIKGDRAKILRKQMRDRLADGIAIINDGDHKTDFIDWYLENGGEIGLLERITSTKEFNHQEGSQTEKIVFKLLDNNKLISFYIPLTSTKVKDYDQTD